MAAAHLGFEFAQEFFVGLTTALTRPPAQRWVLTLEGGEF
jgi:hypothetical protein